MGAHVSWRLWILIASVMLIGACEENKQFSGKRSPDWSRKTHEKNVQPDYDIVFGDQDGINELNESLIVKRIDISITPKNWSTILNDSSMVQLYGSFGRDEDSEIAYNPLTPEETVSYLKSENPSWTDCTVYFNNLKWTHVGVRIKGSNPVRELWKKGIYKLPFELDFDVLGETLTSIEDQRFYGFDSMKLSNNYMDESMLREKFASDVFISQGVPAPVTAFYRLYIDYGEGAKYFGLYTMVEGIAEPFLNKYFSNSDGNLYSSFARFSEPFLHTLYTLGSNNDSTEYNDIKELYDAINMGSEYSALWEKNLESIFDVDNYLHWLAVNTVLQNWNTYGVASNNYALYHDTPSGTFHWIPSGGNNTAFLTIPVPIDPRTIEEKWPFVSKIMGQGNYWNTYVQLLSETVDGISSLDLGTRFFEAHQLIEPYVRGINGEKDRYSWYILMEDGDTLFDDSYNMLDTYLEMTLNDIKDTFLF